MTVAFDAGYPCAQIYAPAGEPVICFEPMTAPTNALVSGTGLRTVGAGRGIQRRVLDRGPILITTEITEN